MGERYSYGGRVDLARLAISAYPNPISLAQAAGLAEIGGSDSGFVSRDIAALVNRDWLALNDGEGEVTATERLVAMARGLKITELESLVGGE